MNDISHHEATMRFLYGYVVRKNISLPGRAEYSSRTNLDRPLELLADYRSSATSNAAWF